MGFVSGPSNWSEGGGAPVAAGASAASAATVPSVSTIAAGTRRRPGRRRGGCRTGSDGSSLQAAPEPLFAYSFGSKARAAELMQ